MKHLVDRKEEDRLKEVQKYSLTDPYYQKKLQELVEFAAISFGVPMVYISFIEDFNQKIKASKGVFLEDMRREETFCLHVLHKGTALIIDDASCDSRFKSNQLVVKFPNIRFYAGAPLITEKGYILGVFCICDTKFRTLSPAETLKLEAFSRLAVNLLDMNLFVCKYGQRNNYTESLIEMENELLQLKEKRIRILQQIKDGITAPGFETEIKKEKAFAIKDCSREYKDSINTTYTVTNSDTVVIPESKISDWTRLVLEQYQRNNNTVSIETFFNEVVADAEQQLAEQGNEIHLNLDGAEQIKGNAEALKFVCNNLLSGINTRCSNSRIDIKTYDDADYLLIVFRHQGTPILRSEIDPLIRKIPSDNDPAVHHELFYTWQTMKMLGGFMSVPDNSNEGSYIALGLPKFACRNVPYTN